jgi:hypothetical protein
MSAFTAVQSERRKTWHCTGAGACTFVPDTPARKIAGEREDVLEAVDTAHGTRCRNCRWPDRFRGRQTCGE